MMKNPIPQPKGSKLFATPESLSELQNYIACTTGMKPSHALVVMSMTLNLCHQLVEKELSKVEA
jgi:hypothetical protein